MSPAPPAIRVNRAPVLTLWATVVAERLGFPPETALTLGRFVAGVQRPRQGPAAGHQRRKAGRRGTPRAGALAHWSRAWGVPENS
jgi:hypothetical protein